MLEIVNTQVAFLDRAIKAIPASFATKDINTLTPITEKNLKRAITQGNAPGGEGHDGYLKGIIVEADVRYTQYWTPQAQRYHFFEIVMSTSKMHCLTKNATKEIEDSDVIPEDNIEQVLEDAVTPNFDRMFNKYVDKDIIRKVQEYAIKYNNAEGKEDKYYWFMKTVSNLPCGYELQMLVQTNYLQLKTMFNQRKHHKLGDWHNFCEWCMSLPRFAELTGCSLPADFHPDKEDPEKLGPDRNYKIQIMAPQDWVPEENTTN